ncbi:MAG: hypothetical protein JW969_02420 [Spirochaetales bacterium]|nr:hypothetical protein [Spirochaetales bacterium]
MVSKGGIVARLFYLILLFASCWVPPPSNYVSLGTWAVGPDEQEIELLNPVPEVRYFKLGIIPDIFEATTEIEVLLRIHTENNPLHFSLVSPCIEIRPRNMELPGDIFVTLPYDDEDDDGIVDGTDIPETDLYPAYYDDEVHCWGPLDRQYIDTSANTVQFTANHLQPFALWASQKDADPVHQINTAAMHVTGMDWVASEEDIAKDLSDHGITTVFVGAYGPDPVTPGNGSFAFYDEGFDEPSGITCYSDIFTLSTFITKVHDKGMQFVIFVDCFNPNSPPDNAIHRAHLLEVFDYFVANYAIDGLMLDHIRYDEGPAVFSFAKIEAVTSFVRELKENHSGGLPVWLNLFRFYNGNFETRIGQRYADLASVCDYMCPMLYYIDETWHPTLTDLIIQTNLTRTAANGVKVIPSLQTFGVWNKDTGELIKDMTGAELGSQLNITCQHYTDGAAFFRYEFMNADKWSGIDDYSL